MGKLTLKQYRINLGWTITRLAQEAGLARHSAASAESGKPIKPDTAKVLADTLAAALGEKVLVSDIEGLNVM